MPSPALILVKHAMPAIVPDVPAREWRLSDAGRAGSRALARLLAAHTPAVVVTSDEPKAAETGQIVATELGLAVRLAPDLHEHDRSDEPFLGQARFEATMKSFFDAPETLIFGHETASRARERFTGAVERVMGDYPNDTVVIVAHGTVISLFVSSLAGIDPYPFWSQLGLPSFVVLERPALRVLSVVGDVVEEQLLG